MSFGTTDVAPQPKPKPLNIEPSRASTNEEARPLPVFWGQARIGTTWLDKAQNVRTKKIKETQQAGKGDSQEVTKGVEYRADLLALACLGPVDELRKIYFNGSKAWGGPITRGAGEAADNFTIHDRGAAAFYYGTANQNVAFGSGHPSYRWQAVLKLNQFLFGLDTTSAPSIELEMSRYPNFSWMVGGRYKIGSDANPIAIIADALTHPLMFGLSPDVLDTVQLNQAAGTLANEGVGLSPLLTTGVKMDQFVAEICSYFDGVPRWVNGKLQIQLQRDAPDRSTLPVLNETNLTDVPQIDGGDWAETFNQTRVTYVRRDNEFKEAATVWSDHGNALLTGSLRTQTLGRPWITTEGQAVRFSSQAGRRASVPTISGRVKTFERPVRHLRCGDFFRLLYSQPQIDLVCRIIDRKIDRPDSREVEFTWTAEPTQDGDSIDATDPRDEPVPPVPVAAAAIRLLELPYPLAGGYQPAVGALVARGNGTTTQFALWASRTAADYENLLQSGDFVVAGVLGEDFQVGTTLDASAGLLLNVGGFTDQGIDELSLDAATVNQTLVLVDGEWMSLSGAALIAPGVYRLRGLIRGRFDTLPTIHVAGAIAIVVSQAQLTRSISPFYSAGQSWNYKIQPAFNATTLDLALIPPVALNLAMNSLRPLTPSNLKASAPPPHGYSDCTLAWSLTSWRNPGFFTTFAVPYADPDVSHVLEIYSGTTLKRSITTVPGVRSVVYTAAQMTADFPSLPATITVRLWSQWTSYRSIRFLETTITPQL